MLQLHSPVPATLKIHNTALARVAQTLGPVWLIEGDCVAANHKAYRDKLQKLKAAHREAAAELEEILAACCQECLSTDAEWERFEAERPSPEARVRAAEREAQSEAHTYQFTPGVDEHPIACGSCDMAIHALANTSLDSERRCG